MQLPVYFYVKTKSHTCVFDVIFKSILYAIQLLPETSK